MDENEQYLREIALMQAMSMQPGNAEQAIADATAILRFLKGEEKNDG